MRGVFNLSCAHDPVSGKGRCFVENAVRADHMLLKAIENLLAAQLSEVRAQMHVLNDRVTRMNARMDGLEKTMAAAFSNLSQELNTYNDVQKLKERMARVEGEYHMKPSA